MLKSFHLVVVVWRGGGEECILIYALLESGSGVVSLHANKVVCICLISHIMLFVSFEGGWVPSSFSILSLILVLCIFFLPRAGPMCFLKCVHMYLKLPQWS